MDPAGIFLYICLFVCLFKKSIFVIYAALENFHEVSGKNFDGCFGILSLECGCVPVGVLEAAPVQVSSFEINYR